MAKHYKIHPGIGIARVGRSEDGYFLQAEALEGTPFELSDQGEVPFSGYKDSSHLIRKQGVRFRVFEYERDEQTGVLQFIGEVTPDRAQISWTLRLGNSKAAGPKISGKIWTSREGGQDERVQAPSLQLRNDGIERSLLQTTVGISVSGNNQALQVLEGDIMGKKLLLGKACTDHLGRLVVVGGSGEAGWWNIDRPVLGAFNNNDGWFDTVADGPVDANLLFHGEADPKKVEGSWVITGPPDFAPGVLPIVSLYDLIFDVLVKARRIDFSIDEPGKVSYKRDILPILQRAADYLYVNENSEWDKINEFIKEGSLGNPQGDQQKRKNILSIFKSIEDKGTLTDFRLTKNVQKALLNEWVNGNFTTEPINPEPTLNFAETLDKANLIRSIGSGLFPGIEMGFLATKEGLYVEPFRFTRGEFQGIQGIMKLEPGSVTQGMALPWQADFMECNTAWWPAQRPDISKFKEDGSFNKTEWVRGLVPRNDDNDEFNDDIDGGSTDFARYNMVKHFAQLGVIEEKLVNGKEIMFETGRDRNLPDVNPTLPA